MHDIIPHMNFNMYQEVMSDGYSVALPFLILSSWIKGFGILHVHLVSVVQNDRSQW